jgi:FAD/FMN-containing dehydrogenase
MPRATPAAGLPENVRPAAIALCEDRADVVTCANWRRQEGVQPVVRGGGHNYIGASTTTGLLIERQR